MLRNALIAVGAGGLVAAAGLLLAGQFEPGFQMLIASGVFTFGVGFERWRYRRSLTGPEGRWLPTGERFRDPTTYRLIDVYYNPDTGERDYRSADDDDRQIGPPA
jgi:hypothetical protein